MTARSACQCGRTETHSHSGGSQAHTLPFGLRQSFRAVQERSDPVWLVIATLERGQCRLDYAFSVLEWGDSRARNRVFTHLVQTFLAGEARAVAGGA